MANNGLLSDADYDAMVQRHASAGVAATGDTSPDHAAQAIDAAPLSQIPPSVGMGAVDLSTRLAAQAARQAAITTSPAVAHFAATADPAHVAVAKDDFPALARIGAAVGDYVTWVGAGGLVGAKLNNPLDVLANTDTGRAVQGSAALMEQGFHNTIVPEHNLRDVLTSIKGMGQLALGSLGAAASAYATLSGPIARAISPLLTTTAPIFPWEAPKPLRTRQEQEAEANNLINLALFGLGRDKGATPASPFAPKLEPPGGARSQNEEHIANGSPPSSTQYYTPKAEADLHAQAVANIQAEVAASATHTRSPSVMEGYLASQTGSHTVTVDPEVVDSLREQGHDPFPEVESGAIEPAEVPLSRYVAQTAGQPFADKLNSTTSFADGVPSVEEAKAGTFTSRPLAENYATHEFEYVSPSGERVSGVITPSENGRLEIDINGVGSELGGSTEGAGRLGVRGVRDLYRQLVAAYPDAQEIVGLRTTGARSEAKEAGIKVKRPTPVPKVEVPPDFSSKEAAHAKNLAAAYHDELNTLVKDLDLHNLFTEAKAVGATKTNFERYSTAIEQHIAEAAQQLTARAEAQVRRERTPEWKTRRAQHMDTVERELAQLPGIQARAAIAQGKGPLGEPLATSLRLDKADPLVKWAADNGLPDKYFKANGLSPDEAAPLFNFKSGADMLRELIALHKAQGDLTIPEHMKSLIAAHADERTRQELGFDLTPESIHQAASEALTGLPTISDFLLDDLKAFADEHGLPFDKEATKAAAQERFETRRVEQASNIKQMEKLLAFDNKKLETALLKGDAANAFKWKQAQYLHQVELTSAHKFLKQFNRSQKLWKNVAKKVTMKGVTQTALNWSKDILAGMGLKVKGNPVDLQRPIGGHLDLSDYIRAMNAEGADINYVPVPRVDPGKMSVAQYRDVADMIQSIMTKGRRDNEVVLDGKQSDLILALSRGVDSLARYTRTISEKEVANPTFVQKLDAGRRAVDAWLVRNEQLMRDFGARDPDSPFFQLVSKPLQARKAWANDTRLDMAKHFREVSKSAGKGFTKWLEAKLPSGGMAEQVRYSDGSNGLVKNRDIMMAALHMGDQEALEAFAAGFNTTPDVVEAAVHEHATPEMWTAVRGIWDAFDKLVPEIRAQYKARNGVTPTLIKPRPFKMPDGSTNPGGYFPIRHDMAKMPKEWVQQQEALDKTLGTPLYQRAVPSNKYLKLRTGAVGPMDMSFNSIYGRINTTIHDLAFRDVLIQMNKFLIHPTMQEAISRKYGPEYVTKIKSDIRDIAGSETQSKIEQQVGRALDYMTEAQMVNMIGFSPKTMLKHGLTAQAQAVTEVGPLRYGASMRRFLLNPNRMMKQAMAESGDIRHILSTYNEDAFRQFLALTSKQGTVPRTVRSFAFHLVGGSNLATAVPLYDAAKLKIADENPNLSPEDVQAAAGQIVRQALGSSGPTDSPMALRMGGGLTGKFFRLTNPFLTFLNHMYNKQREIGPAFGFGGGDTDIGRGLAIMLSAVLIPTYIEQAVSRGEFGFGKDVFEYWAAGLLHNEVGGVPVMNSAVAAAMKKADPRYPGGDDTITSLAGSFGQVAADLNNHFVKHHPWTEKTTEHATIAAGYALRAPGVATMRFEHFLYELRHHEAPVNAIHDFFLGARKGH